MNKLWVSYVLCEHRYMVKSHVLFEAHIGSWKDVAGGVCQTVFNNGYLISST